MGDPPPLNVVCVQLVELEALPRDVSRAVYTQRILEIVGNIRKQKEEKSEAKRS